MWGWILISLAAFAQSNGIISDEILKPWNYNGFLPPTPEGGSYIDHNFKTRISRVTNVSRFNQDLLGGYFSNSEICMFNIDGSYFIAIENENYQGELQLVTFLYDGQTGERLSVLGTGSMRPWWIRWTLADHYTVNGQPVYFDPVYHFYKYEGNEIRLYDVRDTSTWVVLRQFSEYTSIGPAGGEGDISDDGRYWVLDGNEQELFVYDLIDDIKYPASTFDLGEMGAPNNTVGLDYAAISAGGDYVVAVWGSDAALDERYHGIEIYDKNWNFIHQIHPGKIHLEMGIDAFGDDVVYTAATYGFNDFFAARGVVPGDLISIRLADAQYRLLKHIPIWAHFNITACNSVTDGSYVYYSYGERSTNPDSLWAPFWSEIIEVPTDGSGAVRRLVHNRSHEISGKIMKYWQPDPLVNRQGTKILYRSTYAGEIGELYLFDVGSRNDPPPSSSATIKMTLQGFYDLDQGFMQPSTPESWVPLSSPYSEAPRTLTQMPEGVVDWVLVSLRELETGPVLAYTSALLFQDGYLGMDHVQTQLVNWEGLPDGDYSIIIEHRNHMSVMTASSYSFSESMPAFVDLTLDNQTINGPNSVVNVVSGHWALWAGDLDSNLIIDQNDFTLWKDAAAQSESGYRISDLNGDSLVTTRDYRLWFNNYRAGAYSIIPE